MYFHRELVPGIAFDYPHRGSCEGARTSVGPVIYVQVIGRIEVLIKVNRIEVVLICGARAETPHPAASQITISFEDVVSRCPGTKSGASPERYFQSFLSPHRPLNHPAAQSVTTVHVPPLTTHLLVSRVEDPKSSKNSKVAVPLEAVTAAGLP